MSGLFPIAAITDEFSPDLETALSAMTAVGMTGAELRTLSGKNIVDLTDDELDRTISMVREAGLEIVSIASPLLKCELPDAPEIDGRFQQDRFAAPYRYEDQPRLTARSLEIAKRSGARILRVFSYWRTVRPEACFDRIVKALRELAEAAAPHGVIIGLENEHACNIATGAETARLLDALDHPGLQVVWDPANALVSGEEPYPGGYEKLPAHRIGHVHAKDCSMDGLRPLWRQLGEGAIDWQGQIAGLTRDGYRGWVSLETHWQGPDGDKLEGSRICGRNLARLVGQ